MISICTGSVARKVLVWRNMFLRNRIGGVGMGEKNFLGRGFVIFGAARLDAGAGDLIWKRG